jgi:hypothetical protein
MNTLKPTAKQVIDATVATVEIMRRVCGIELEEAKIDALLCTLYREYISSGGTVGAHQGGPAPTCAATHERHRHG